LLDFFNLSVQYLKSSCVVLLQHPFRFIVSW